MSLVKLNKGSSAIDGTQKVPRTQSKLLKMAGLTFSKPSITTTGFEYHPNLKVLQVATPSFLELGLIAEQVAEELKTDVPTVERIMGLFA